MSMFVDTYKSDGTLMWRVDRGPNSPNTDLSLSGPATIGAGHADDETERRFGYCAHRSQSGSCKATIAASSEEKAGVISKSI